MLKARFDIEEFVGSNLEHILAENLSREVYHQSWEKRLLPSFPGYNFFIVDTVSEVFSADQH